MSEIHIENAIRSLRSVTLLDIKQNITGDMNLGTYKKQAKPKWKQAETDTPIYISYYFCHQRKKLLQQFLTESKKVVR